MANSFREFMLDEMHKEVRDLAKKFSDEKVAPTALALDQKREYPLEQLKELGALGLLSTLVPEEYGGAGMDEMSHVMVMEEMGRNSGTLAFVIDTHCSLGIMPMLIGGSEEQKQKYLPAAAAGESFFGFALTEPHSGSDAGGTKTTAVLDEDEWVINGSKSWITNIGIADNFLVCCKTDPSAPGSKGISLILVPKDAPGFIEGKCEEKMCIRGSHTGQLFFDNCRVPKENLVGELNRGLPLFMQGLDEGRIAIGAISVGMAQGVLERVTRYAKEREAFGKVITEYQGVSFKLSEMEIEINAARAMLYEVAKMRDAGLPFRKEAAMLKVFTSEMVCDVCEKGMQVMGGNGLSEEYEIERFMRDARLCVIGEGTTEINKMLISRYVLKEY